MYELPVTIDIDDVELPIRNKGDYRMVLDCFLALEDIELDETERILAALIIFYEDLDADKVLELSEDELKNRIHEMYLFFNCGQEQSQLMKTPYKVMDWEQDSQLIISAVNNVAKKEVRAEPYIHWWTFMGYYMTIGEGAFATVVSIRYKMLKGKKLEKYENEFKRDNPQYFTWNCRTVEEQQADKLVRDMWNSNSN